MKLNIRELEMERESKTRRLKTIFTCLYVASRLDTSIFSKAYAGLVDRAGAVLNIPMWKIIVITECIKSSFQQAANIIAGEISLQVRNPKQYSQVRR